MANEVKEQEVPVTKLVATVIEESVTRNLATRNITNEVIERYAREYMQLKINGIEDRDGYKAVYDARQVAKKTRIVIKEICEEGRAPLQSEVKEWIKKEKELVAKVTVIEEYLQKQEDDYNAAKEQIRIEKEKAETERLRVRDGVLAFFGARCNGIDYILDDLNYSLATIKGASDVDFNEKIVPIFKGVFEAKEKIAKANREAKELIEKQEREARQEFERQQEELRKSQQKLREQQEEIDRKEKERQDDLQKKRDLEIKNLINSRSLELEAMGFTYSRSLDKWCLGDGYMLHPEVLYAKDDDEWKGFIEEYTPRADEYKAFLAKENNDRIEKEKKDAVEKAEKERKEKEENDRIKKQQELEEANDKTKYSAIVDYLKRTPLYDMRSGQYRQKMIAIRSFIDDLK
jgi:hypothetical protein